MRGVSRRFRIWSRRVVISLFSLLSLLWLVDPFNPFDSETDNPPPVVDAYMSEARALRFNQDGTLKEDIQTAFWQHLLASETTEMTTLHVDLYQPDGSLWHITANKGLGHHKELASNFNDIELSDDVRISRAVLQDHDALTWHLKTEHLTLNESFASTDEPVSVQGPESLINAIGLKADLESGYVEFLSQVRTQYHTEDMHL